MNITFVCTNIDKYYTIVLLCMLYIIYILHICINKNNCFQFVYRYVPVIGIKVTDIV